MPAYKGIARSCEFVGAQASRDALYVVGIRDVFFLRAVIIVLHLVGYTAAVDHSGRRRRLAGEGGYAPYGVAILIVFSAVDIEVKRKIAARSLTGAEAAGLHFKKLVGGVGDAQRLYKREKHIVSIVLFESSLAAVSLSATL